MVTASISKEKTSHGKSFVTGAPNGESGKNAQFIKDVSIHTFPSEGSEGSQSLRYLQWARFVHLNREFFKINRMQSQIRRKYIPGDPKKYFRS